MNYYQDFQDLTDELYPECTTEQKLGVYIQHRPGAVVPFLLELILELHPDPDPADDKTPDPDR
jgi:hypothetical protein